MEQIIHDVVCQSKGVNSRVLYFRDEVEEQPQKRKYPTRTKDPSNTVTCAYCNEKFKNTNSLKSHVSKAKGTQCSIEHATSGKSANLEERKKIEAKKFVCKRCGMRYISQESLDRHVRGVHKKIKQ